MPPADPTQPADDFPAGQTGDMRDLLLSPPSGTLPASAPAAPWQPPSAEELQKLLPQYEITALLGRGGMGAVYKGMQIALDRPVAIKILSNRLDETDASFAERFKNEARAMAKLSHPGIVGVYDFGETAGGLLYIVMEFIEGTDVAKMIAEQKRLHTEHAMAITAHVCDALAYAHERGIIHRDIKPANIMVGYDGVVKVADFGLAKMTQSQNSGLTQSGMAMGTLHYMAPEALMLGSAVDHRADIYAVGVMLYQMLTGKIPQGLFELPSLQVPGLDPRYDGIIGKALREDREVRYPSVLDMRHDLDAILTQPVVKVEAAAAKAPAALKTQARPLRPGGQPYRPPRPEVILRTEKKGSPLLWAAVVALAALAAWLYWNKTLPESAPQQPSLVTDKPPAPAVNESSAASTSHPAEATKGRPFVNSLGMKFVPVPGTKVLFCIHETRKADYAAYAVEKAGLNGFWKSPTYDGAPVSFADDHPVCNVSWEECRDFCEWLSRKEGRTYRLPTDREWSFAVGIGEREDASLSPHLLSDRLADEFPWGSQWPPPAGVGNLGDTTMAASFPKRRPIPGYTDGFATTAPVMSFSPNRFGLYDLAGNVWEFCEDWYDGTQTKRVIRGLNFDDGGDSSVRFLSSHRGLCPVGNRHSNFGFRCVLVEGSQSASVAAAPVMPPSPPQPSGSAGTALPTAPTPSQSHKPADTQGMELLVDVDFVKPHEGFPATTTARLIAEWQGGRYQITALSSAIWIPPQPAIQNLTLTDFVCEVEAQIPRQAEGSWAIRLANKNQRKGDYIQDFRLDAAGKAMIPTPTHRQGIPLDTAASPVGAGWNKMRVEAANSRYRLFINDRFVTEVPQEGRLSPNGIVIPINTPAPGLEVWVRRVRVWQPKVASTPAAHALPTGPTTWTDTKGRSISATFKAIADDNVLLDIAGTITPVALNTLSAESQKLAHDYQRAAVASAAASSPAGQVSLATAAAQATREAPFVNTLGMKFVPVPGTRLLMCVHETRRADYAEYALKVPGVASPWQTMGFKGMPSGHEDDHPVTGVSWEDANAFCRWLSEKERLSYRLPTDAEWSAAAGLAEKRTAETTPEMLDGLNQSLFPWGDEALFKGRDKPGNYMDTSYVDAFKPEPKHLVGVFTLGYADGFATTAPVMSFRPNAIGLYDLGGNVREWCADWYHAARQWRVARGSSWQGFRREDLLTSVRAHITPQARLADCGFRCVLDLQPPATTTPAPAASTADGTVKLEFKNAEKYFDVGGYYPSEVPMSATRPASIIKTPAGLVSALYGELVMGSGENQRRHAIVISAPKTTKAALFVDSNANGDLSDDPPARWQVAQTSAAEKTADVFQGEFQVELIHGDGPHLARFLASQNTGPGSTSSSLWIHPQYGRVGTVRLGGKPFDALLYDDGGTGDFSAPTSTFRLDLDKRGGFRWEEAEAFPVTEYFTVDGANYQLSGLTPGGETFKIVPSQGWTGKVAPAFSAATLSGETVQMPADYRGKLLLLHFWSTGQKSGLEDLPHLKAVYEKHHSVAFDMLGICVEYRRGKEQLPAFVKENAIAWPQSCEHQTGAMNHPLLQLFQCHSVPNNFLIQADTGKVLACGLRGSALESAISRALAEKNR